MTGLLKRSADALEAESLRENATAEDVDKLGQHARLTYIEVLKNGAARNPLQEDTGAAVVHLGQRRARVRVIPANGSDVRLEEVYLKRTDGRCTQVYRRTTEKKTVKKSIQFDGDLIVALRMEAVEGHTDLFREPEEEEADKHLVAIKKQSLAKIQYFLSRGHHENPFTAIARMQKIGDNVHVLGCIEALKDEKNLYTIMEYCDGTVLDLVPRQEGDVLPEAEARECMRKVWKSLHYLQSRGVVHHDLSPDNIMCLRGNLVLSDLAMSLQVESGSCNRHLLLPQGVYGKEAYMSPEVHCNKTPFDGFSLDVWSSGCILYNLLTGCHLYNRPHPEDILFKFFVMAKGLSNTPLNDRTIDIMVNVYQKSNNVNDRQPLLTRTMANVRLSSTVKQLFENMFCLIPANRYTLAQCMESNWAQGEEHLWMERVNQ